MSDTTKPTALAATDSAENSTPEQTSEVPAQNSEVSNEIIISPSSESRANQDSSSASAGSPFEISKKELLAETGISYGQLYRWKREGLIPEEWFEKRSAFTGQETYFPREHILERVRVIQSMKDVLSLSEIRERIKQGEGRPDLRRVLLSVPEATEAFIDSLSVDLSKVVLPESSVKIVVLLISELDKTKASQSLQSSLVSQVIAALDTADSTTTDSTSTSTSTSTSEEG